MKELRDIKLDLLMGNQNPIVNLFNQITKDIKIINTNVYHDQGLEFIYFSGDQWIFYQDFDNEEFWCNYERYWSFFETNLGLEYGDIQEVTKYLVEEALKREVGTPIKQLWETKYPVEEALKREVSTSILVVNNRNSVVKNSLKREINTPLTTLNNVFALEVQDALKKEIATPDKMTAMVGGLVERSIKKNKL